MKRVHKIPLEFVGRLLVSSILTFFLGSMGFVWFGLLVVAFVFALWSYFPFTEDD